MEYIELSKVYQELEKTSKRLEKTHILSEFLKKCSKEDLDHIIYLVEGKVFPSYDERKIGMSSRLTI